MNLTYINRFFVYLLCAILSFGVLAADPVDWMGKVMDSDGKPLVGVAVTNADGEVLTYTDKEGRFSIAVDNSESLSLTSEGFKPYQLATSADEKLIIYMESDDQDEIQVNPPEKIELPFGTFDDNRIVGAVNSIDVPQELTIDQRTSIGSALNGKIPGVFYTSNIRGYGNPAVIVDGVPRDIGAYNLTEIESITVLKDATARMLYGSQADNGVILVTTKRGQAGRREIRARAEYGVQSPVLMPKYLGAADYMSKYNEAAANDGVSARYSPTQIENTRNGTDPVLNPDEDFFDNRFIGDQRSYVSANLDASGGNDFGTYFVNMGFSSNNDYYNIGGDDLGTTGFNVRANTDFRLNDVVSLRSDIVTTIFADKSPVADYWGLASTQLPNSYPVFIPTNRVSNSEVLSGAVLANGDNLLGGTQEFQTNLFGEIDRRGSQTNTIRLVQFNAGLNFDFNKYIPGLTASTLVSFDFLNTFVENQAATYAIYQAQPNGDSLNLEKIGIDFQSTQNSPSVDQSYAHRRYGLFGTINYQKDLGAGDLDITSVVYLDRLDALLQEQPSRNLHYGLRANYIHDNKYIVEFSGAYMGSPKLTIENQFTFAPSVGAGWIISNEDFFGDGIDYLKIKGSYGILKNDNWNGNFLQESYYQFGNNFNYNNGGGQNTELDIVNVGSQLDWQKREEINAGFEAAFLNSALSFEANYFRSRSFDNVKLINNTTPTLVGYDLYDNFNSDITQGVDAGLTYSKSFGDLVVNLGTYFVYAKNEIEQIDEVEYLNAPYRQRVGTDGWSYVGYVSDGLYGESDFNTDGTLVDGLPATTFGAVQAGDIKYTDLNDDGVINQDDQQIIGSTFPSTNYSVRLDIRYKGFGLFALGTGNIGDDGYRNNPYFWVYGDRKYSAMVNQAYGPNNQNTNAIMPRLSTSANNNNYRLSDYWLYNNSIFNIPVIQLSYTYAPESGVFNNLTFFVKGNNLVRINKNWSDLRIGSAPINQGFSVGLTGNF